MAQSRFNHGSAVINTMKNTIDVAKKEGQPRRWSRRLSSCQVQLPFSENQSFGHLFVTDETEEEVIRIGEALIKELESGVRLSGDPNLGFAVTYTKANCGCDAAGMLLEGNSGKGEGGGGSDASKSYAEMVKDFFKTTPEWTILINNLKYLRVDSATALPESAAKIFVENYKVLEGDKEGQEMLRWLIENPTEIMDWKDVRKKWAPNRRLSNSEARRIFRALQGLGKDSWYARGDHCKCKILLAEINAYYDEGDPVVAFVRGCWASQGKLPPITVQHFFGREHFDSQNMIAGLKKKFKDVLGMLTLDERQNDWFDALRSSEEVINMLISTVNAESHFYIPEFEMESVPARGGHLVTSSPCYGFHPYRYIDDQGDSVPANISDIRNFKFKGNLFLRIRDLGATKFTPTKDGVWIEFPKQQAFLMNSFSILLSDKKGSFNISVWKNLEVVEEFTDPRDPVTVIHDIRDRIVQHRALDILEEKAIGTWNDITMLGDRLKGVRKRLSLLSRDNQVETDKSCAWYQDVELIDGTQVNIFLPDSSYDGEKPYRYLLHGKTHEAGIDDFSNNFETDKRNLRSAVQDLGGIMVTLNSCGSFINFPFQGEYQILLVNDIVSYEILLQDSKRNTLDEYINPADPVTVIYGLRNRIKYLTMT